MPDPPVFGELDARKPIVMLPVRLETRYFDAGGGALELRVRLFPSAAHVTADRPGVEPVERAETVAYWRTRRARGDAAPETDAAWQRLVQLFGEPRARWLQHVLTPTGGAPDSLVFPEVPLAPPPEGDGSPGAVALTSEAIALPTRFFVAGYAGGARTFLTMGGALPPSVHVGPHGDADAIRWQSDFVAAEAIGLGVRVRMERPEAARLTRLLAFGLREGADAEGGQEELERLLGRHAREDGVALLAAGTPTNHTPAARVEPYPAATGEAPPAGSDGARLASALGVEPAALALASGASATTEPRIEAMHAALWPATLGYFLEQMMAPLVPAAAVARGRALFQKFVRPRGPFPSLVLGGQPHGVLPISSLARWRSAPTQGDQRLVQALAGLRARWLAASAKVPRLGGGRDPGSELAAVLAQSPVSTRWVARTLEPYVVAQRGFGGFDSGQFDALRDQLRRAIAGAELAPVGLAGEPRALDFVFHGSFDLRAALVAPAGAAKDAVLSVNYIDGIAAATVEALKGHGVAGAAPRTLLYLLLRHATLLVMARAADRVLGQLAVAERVFVESAAETVWTRLDAPVASLGNRPLSAVFAGRLPAGPNFGELAQHRRALKALGSLPVAELERLTAEAIDGASHRLDAWITALASERLAAMRAATPRGSHLGAYAWVDAPPVPAVLAQDGAPPADDPDSEGYIHAPRLDHARTAAILRGAFLAREREGAEAPLALDLTSDRVRAARQLLDGVRNGAGVAALLGERIERWMVELGFGPQLPDLRREFTLVDGSGRMRIDGLEVARAWRDAPPAGLLAVAQRLDALTDAVGDLLLAEGVHQQASGNPGRAQPALAALDTGVTLPTELDVVRSEADSSARTWRLVLPLGRGGVEAWTTSILKQVAGEARRLSATVTPERGAPVSVPLARLGVRVAELLDWVRTGPDAPALAARFVEVAGKAGPVAYSPALAATLAAAAALRRLLQGARPLQAGDVGPGRDPAPELALASRQKEWLHDLSRVRPAIEALDALDLTLRGVGLGSAARVLDLRFVDTGPGLRIVSLGELPASSAAEGLLVDGWSEVTPGLEATTGIALHYDAPRARAPQAMLLLVPPDPAAGWGIDVVEASLLETAELAQIRMVRPPDVHGAFLPALYFADNLAADTISTDFLELGFVARFTE